MEAQNSQNVEYTFTGIETKVTETPGYYEEYLDPAADSIAASIFTLGWAAVGGVNCSKIWIDPVPHYSTEEKDFDYTFF